MKRSSFLKDNLLVISIVGLVLMAYLYAGSSDVDNETFQLEYYCDMVSKHYSNPDIGWPDYKGTYSRDCKD